MRPDGSDNLVELNFDCGPMPTIKRTDNPGMGYVRLETISGNVGRTATGICVVPPGMNALCVNQKGTLLARTGPQGRLVLIPPRSLTYLRPGRFIVQAARGEHVSQLLSWDARVTSLLETWLPKRAEGKVRNLACKAIDPLFRETVDRLSRAISGPTELMEPLVVSFLYEACARLSVGGDQVQLAPIPLDVPETITSLIGKVRQNPANPWPLKEAADMAGYSPFHFSRVFKQIVGYGFHEYVDRCRTECAVELLVTTDNAVDMVASTCGFGTTQGLRESVKEYLGLVPSELRSVPDAIDFGE